jgi:ubiquinone/menaquinone biosynthesis C-methylase UbiE
MKNEWLFDEYKICSVDYSDIKIVENYDLNHQKFRNYANEAKHIVDLLNLSKDDVVMDIGCGTCGVTLELSKFVKKAFAVDISRGMLDYASLKANKLNRKNIEFINAGFLSLNKLDEDIDAVITSAALHHLPDFWKMIALNNIADILKKDGKFYLFDVVFNFEPAEYDKKFEQYIDLMTDRIGASFKKEIIYHIKDEYSTFDFLLDEMLKKAGFIIKHKNKLSEMEIEYMCINKKSKC